MADELDVKSGYTPDDVAALIETLRGMVDLEEGELYTFRKGKLHHVTPRDEENGLRRIKVMEEAHEAAQIMAKRLRKRMHGYRPDPALVVSAWVMYAAEALPEKDADDIAIAYLQRLFGRAEPVQGEESDSSPDGATEAGQNPASATGRETGRRARRASRTDPPTAAP
jgi:hypothetical protein